MYKLFMALRYLRANPVIYASILSVALGIAVIVVVNSVMSGFSRDIRERIRGMQSHLVVKGRSGDIHIDDYEPLLEKLRSIPHVAGATPRVQTYAWLGYTGREADAIVVGIDPRQERGASKVEEFFRRGGKRNFDFRYDTEEASTYPGIVVGSEMARLFGSRAQGAAPGLMTASRRGAIPQLFNANFEVVGTFNSGMNEYDMTFLFMDLEEAQRFLRLRGPDQRPLISYVAINIDDYARRVAGVRKAVIDALHDREPCRMPDLMHEYGICGKYLTRTWEEEKRNLLQAVAIEKGLQIVLLFFIILVAAINILTIYTLMVRAKTRDIGILRSLGASTPGIAQVFLTSGLLCGLIGGVFGSILGLKTAVNLDGVAEVIETSSRDLADWARENQESLLVRGSFWGGVGLFLALVAAYVLLVVKRSPLRRPIATPLGLLWVALLAVTAFWLVRDATGLAGEGGWVQGLGRILSWAVFALTLSSVSLHLVDKPDPWLGRLRGAALAALGAGLVVALVGLLGRPDFWEALVSDLAFDGLLAAAAIHLAFAYAEGWRRSTAPHWLVFSLAVSTLLATLPLAGFLNWPPPPGWPGLNLFPKDVYYLDRIPSEASYMFVGIIVVAATLTAVAASIYPAIKASRFDPVEAIRRE
jgi:lipoprotein-releasing system permease protein